MKKLVMIVVALLCALTLALAGCAAEVAAATPISPETTTVVSPVYTPAPSPTPTPIPLPTEEDILASIASTDVLAYIPADTYTYDESLHNYEVVTAQPDTAYALPGQYESWLQAVQSNLENDPHATSVTVEGNTPSWQLLSVLTYNFSTDPAALSTALQSICDFDISITPGESDGDYALRVTATPKNPVDLFYSLETAGDVTPLSNLFSYAYISTIYDDEMNVRDGIGTPDLPTFLFPIEHPSRYYFDDTWYAGRDKGTRRHAGTDINAPEGTNLLACVDGVIFDAGSNKGAGNYVVVRGEDGTQYHYYHMVEPTDLQVGDVVQMGDVVGHVGNTGNSAANHLHFTIITADGHYLNPYTYLKSMQDLAIEAGNR